MKLKINNASFGYNGENILENFTFEMVEEVPKEKLREREKYWIMFYGSKEYGLNERNG